MKAYSSFGGWLLLGSIALACSGTSFSSGSGGAAGSDTDGGSDANGGVLNRAGRGNGGSLIGKAGTTSTSGTDAGGTDAGGTDTGGADTGGTTSSGGTGMAGDISVGGDVVTAGTSSGGGSAGTTSTAGSAGTNGGPPVDVICPKGQPSSGGLCKEGLICSYGTDLRASCRSIAKCSGGKWSVEKSGCTDMDACEKVIVGAACSPGAADCILDSGVFCVCTSCSGVGPCDDTYEWACAGSQGGNACPKSPPNWGQSCLGDAQCPYGSCATGSNVIASCNAGTWGWEQSLCPLAVQ